MRSSLRKKSSFYEKEIILLGKESSIMRRKCLWEKEFCQKKEVLLLQRIFYYEEGVLLWKKRFCNKEVLVWKTSSTKKRKFLFCKKEFDFK